MFMEPIKINIYGNSFAVRINIFYYTVQKNTITKQEALLNACVQTESVSKRKQQQDSSD